MKLTVQCVYYSYGKKAIFYVKKGLLSKIGMMGSCERDILIRHSVDMSLFFCHLDFT